MRCKLRGLCQVGLLVSLATLVACRGNAPDQPVNLENSSSPPAVSTPKTTASEDAIAPTVPPVAATIAEIQKMPVFVRLLNLPQEQPAKQGMGLQVGETIRTEKQALAQVNLKNGLAFRIGGNAVLTLQPQNQLNLTSGEMITWVEPGRKVPSEIVTPTAVAGIRGTTVYVKIPRNSQEGTLFFAWEGIVSVRLPGQTESITLKTAEEVRIRPGERDIRAIRRRIRRLSRKEWQQKRRSDRLLRGFATPLPTLPIIEQVKPGQVKPSPTPTR